MFIGEYQHSLDSKNRIIIPAKFRDGLGSHFVMTKGMDNSLFVYPMKEWSLIEEKLKALSFTKKNVRDFHRMFFSGAIECELDKQGRVTISSNLVKHAKLLKDATIIGVSTRVEIWASESWETYNQSESMDYDSLSEKMSEFDLNL